MVETNRCLATSPSMGVQCDRTLVGPLWHPYPHRHEYAEGPIKWVEWSSTNGESYAAGETGEQEMKIETPEESAAIVDMNLRRVGLEGLRCGRPVRAAPGISRDCARPLGHIGECS